MNSQHEPRDGQDRPGDTTSGTGTPPPAASPAQQPPTAHRFYIWLRSLGIRRGENRWIGGVASGIADRIGIDPVIVRGLFILFVVFGGVGVLLYGLAWALLPEPDGRIHLEGAGRGYWSDGMTGALIVTIFGLFRPFGDWWSGAWGFGDALWTLIWVGGLIALGVWLVNAARDKKERGKKKGTTAAPGNSQPATAQPGEGQVDPGAQGPTQAGPTAQWPDEVGPGPTGQAGSSPEGQHGRGPSSSGGAHSWPAAPAGTAGTTAPAGTDAPEYAGQGAAPRPRQQSPVYGPPRGGPAAESVAPYDTHTKPPRPTPSAAMVAISTGLAMLVGGGLLALHYTEAIDLGVNANSTAAAAAAVVLGLSIVISGLGGRTSGTMGFLAVVALVAAVVLGLVPTSNNYVILSSASWQPDTIDQAQTGYTTTMAEGTIDLGGIEGPLEDETVVPVNVAMGDATVVLPEDIPVEVQSNLVMGAVDFDFEGTASGGIWNPANRTFNADAPGEKVIIDVDGFFSSVTIAGPGNGFSR